MKRSLKKWIAILMLFLHGFSIAEPIVADKVKSPNLQVDKAPNGVPLVNIEAPDKNGTSHNVYKDYNVDSRGAILNNSKDLIKSELGGLIYGNPNLQNRNEASTIINEVSGINRSRIEGYQEIAGKKADYILANPNGIYINGAGFINTGDVKMVTAGSKNNFEVENGKIEIAGQGLDLRNIDKSELITRIAEIYAPIYAGEELNIKLGSNAKKNKPEFALDGKVLGSMYAGRIKIISNEEGVGVKSQGITYADKGDVIISSKGKVYLKNTQAKNNINISAKETEINEKLLAENKINIIGNLKNQGQIRVNNQIEVDGNLENNNQIISNKYINVAKELKNNKELQTIKLKADTILNNGNFLVSENTQAKEINNFNQADINTRTLNSDKIKNMGSISSENISNKNLVNKGVILANNLNTKEIENNKELKINNSLSTEKLLNLKNGSLKSENVNIKELSNQGYIKSRELKTNIITNIGDIETENLSSEEIKNDARLESNNSLATNSLFNYSKGILKTLNLDSKEIKNQGIINSQDISNTNLINTGKIIAKNISSKDIETNGELSAIEKITADSLTALNNSKISTKNLNIQNIKNVGNISSENISNKNLENKGIILANNLNTKEIENNKELKINNLLSTEKLLNLENGSLKSENVNIKELSNQGYIKSRELKIDIITNIGDIETDNLLSNEIKNDGRLESNSSLITNSLFNYSKGALKTVNLDSKEIKNQGIINSQDISNTNLINIGKIIAKNISSKDIETNGELSALEKITADSLIALNNSKISTKNLNISDIQNAGKITANDIENKSIINKGNILSNNIVSLDIKNDNKILINNNLSANSLLNYLSGNISSENTNIESIRNSGRINSRNIQNKNINNSGIVISEDLKSNDIENTSRLIVTKNLITNKLTNIGETYSANLNSTNTENKGNLEALTLIGENIQNSGKVLTNDINIKNIENSKIFTALNSINSDKIENSGDIKSKNIVSAEILNKENISSKNISTTNLNNNGNIFSENLITKNTINSKNLQVSENLKTEILKNEDNSTLLAKNIEALNIENKSNLMVTNNLKSNEVLNSSKLLVRNELKTKNLENSAKVEAKTVYVTESLSNENANINVENINITSSKIKNKDGKIQASNSIEIKTKDKLELEGTYLANNKLDIEAKTLVNNVDLENNGSIRLNIDDGLVNNNKIIAGNNLDLKVKDLVNNKEIGAKSTLNIEASNFSNTGITNFGAKENVLKVQNNIENTGFIYSTGNLDIKAKDIENRGQIATVKDLTMDVNNLANRALMFSAKDINVKFKENFLNEKADIYTENNFTALGTGDFINRLGDITSIGNIKITADNIRNIGEVTGNYEIKGKVEGNKSNVDITPEMQEKYKEETQKIAKRFFREVILKNAGISVNEIGPYVRGDGRPGEKADGASWTWFWGQNLDGVYLKEIDNIVSNYTSKQATIKANENIDLIANNEVENLESNILANKNIDIKAQKLSNINFLIPVEREAEFRRHFEFHGNAMHKAMYKKYYLDGKVYNYNEDKADAIIKDFITTYVGSDKGSLISAGENLNITANKVGNGLFKENIKTGIDKKNINVGEVVLNKKTIDERTALNTSNYIFIPDDNIDEKDEFVSDKEGININENSIYKKKDFKSDTKKITHSNAGLYNGNNFNIEKENISIGKGMFKLNKIADLSDKPGFSYLIETNVKFLNKSLYLGSDYFFSKLNFNPDKNIRLLGDSYYENKLINRTILEGTGRRYLQDFKTEKEQMQYLYDNGIKASKDLNLSLGVALTKEQIDNLNKDIIWYVYEEVKGVQVLVPKLYLAKGTLAKLRAPNNSGLYAGNTIAINAKEIVNTGDITAKNINTNSETFTNLSLLGTNANILGDNISINTTESIDNIGANISAYEDLKLMSSGDINNLSTKRVNGYGNDLVSNLENLATISGKNIEILTDTNIINVGAKISASENLNMEADNINLSTLETERYFQNGDGRKNYTIIDNKKNEKSEVTAGNLNVKAAEDINIKGTDIVAKEDLNISAGGDIDIVSATDSQYYEEMKSKKKRFGRSKSSHKIDYKETLVKSNILAGNDVNISSDKNILVTGSDIYALNNVNIDVKEDLTIESGLEGNSTVRQTTKTGLFKLSGKAKMEDNLKYTNAESVIGAEKDINLNSEKNVNVVASELTAGENINIKAKENVNILAADDKFKSEKKESKYSVKPFASAKGLKFEIGLKANQVQTKENNFSTKVKGSQITVGNNVNIKSDKDTNIQASSIKSENTNINTKGQLNLLTKDEISINNMSGTEIESKLSAKLDLSGIKDTVKSVVDTVKGLPELPKAVNAATNLVSGKDINESLAGNEEGIEELSRILNGPKSGGVSAGIYGSSSLEKTKSKTEIKNSVGSNILSKENISFTSEEDMKLKRANIQGKNITINSKKDILIESGVSTLDSKRSSQSLNGEINLLTGQFNVGSGVTKDKSTEKTHTNSQIYGENIAIKSKDLSVKGGNIEADKVDIEAKNLHIESMQDKANSKHQALNISVGSSSAGGGIEYGKYEKEWVEKQSTIIGREKSEIDVAEKTNIIGAVIGGADTTLKTKELEYSNIEDKEKGFNVGMNTSTNIKLRNIYNETDPNNPNKQLNISKSGSFNYDAVDKEQINRATIGAGTIIVDGKEINPDINRDENKAQEITKDISVDKVGIEYSDNRKEWSLSSLQDIFGEQLKEAVIVPMDTLNKKLKLDEKNDFFVSDIAVYKLVVEKDLEGNIKENYIQVPNDTIFEKGSVAHTNGMNTNEVVAKDETIKLHLKKDINDNKLHYLENGEKKEFYVLQNRTHGNNSDLYESAIDKFGIKGDKKVYSEAAKELGEIIWRNRENIEEKSLFSQGNIQYYAALHYIEEKYGVGALEKIKTKKYTSAGSPLNAIDLISYLKNKKIIENPTVDNIIIKNDKLDLVTNIVGFNGTSILSRDPNMRKKIEEKEKYGIKYDIWAAHSHYSKGSKPNSYIDYSTWQKPLIYSDKFLKMLNIQNYFKNKEKIEINKGAERNEDIK